MPYVFYDELPEGLEEVDVVTREEYDAVVAERDSTAQQRDDALTRIVEAEREVRDAKAKYADAILSHKPSSGQGGSGKSETVSKPKLKMGSSQLFGKE